MKKYYQPLVLLSLIALLSGPVIAGGISADAGLTPALNKWIVRTQVRFMQRDNDQLMMPKEMKTFMFPLVIAYGIRSDLTLMIRQTHLNREMTMGTDIAKTSGLGDFFAMAKYRALRYNSRNYTFGIAPFVGMEFPTGKTGFSSESSNLKTGVYFSGRKAPLAADLNIIFAFRGISGDKDRVKNSAFESTLALANQFDLGNNSRIAMAPVFEISYFHSTPDKVEGVERPNSGESWFKLAPGFKFTYSSVIIEALVQIPVWQKQEGDQTEIGIGGLLGLRIFL